MPCQYNKGWQAWQILEAMRTFEEIWSLLSPQGEFRRRRGACERLWQSYGPAKQEEIYAVIEGKLQRGEFVNENPYFAIDDNACRANTRKPPQTLSFAAYYDRYGTTEETDGWKRQFIPAEQKTIYVKG